MKKTIHIILAIAALVSCAKTGVVYPSASEIRIEPMTVLSTKANHLGAVVDSEYPANENFDVYGYWSDDWDSGNVITYLISPEPDSGVEFVREVNYWVGKIPYYWPKYGSLKFACYSPSSLNIEHDYATNTFRKTGYEQPSKTDMTWDLLLAPTTGAYTAPAAADHVTIAFEHALSWITFQVKAKDAVSENVFDIHKVTIKNVCTKADFQVKMADGIQYEEWENQSDKKDIVVFDASQVVKQESKDIETNAHGTIIIPQATEGTELVIEYTQLAIPGSTAELTNQRITLPLTLNPNRSVWEPGKRYTYTLIFKLDEIRIKPTVKPWSSVNVENIL